LEYKCRTPIYFTESPGNIVYFFYLNNIVCTNVMHANPSTYEKVNNKELLKIASELSCMWVILSDQSSNKSTWFVNEFSFMD
jgi:hypothetical protein